MHGPAAKRLTILAAFGLATITQPSAAAPLCIKDRAPFELAQDAVTWTMAIAPDASCLQGLRYSYMQIYEVKVVSGPSNGKLEIVGPGFRYAANDARPDKFTLQVAGKNRRTEGTSTIEVDVNPAATATAPSKSEQVAAVAKDTP